VDLDGKVAFYAGRGPFDFRIPPVERTLQRLTANKGRMPPMPPYRWSEPVDGLRCGLSFDPSNLSVGEDVMIRLAFQNVSDNPIALHYDRTEVPRYIDIRNDDGHVLNIAVAEDPRRARMRRYARNRGDSNPVRRIEPDGVFESEIEGKLVGASGQTPATAGQFHGEYVYEATDGDQNRAEPGATELWTGKIVSAVCALDVTLPRQPGCADCHGGADFHHAQTEDCAKCHVGRMGEADFGLRPEACAACHRREGLRGRRQILGAGGEFDLVSRHFSGTVTDADCLLCHDHSRHGDGVVSLIDPDSGGARPWTGTRTGFCLTCHDGRPPAGVSLPDQSQGSGFDKTGFMASMFALSKQGCNLCHQSHGSAYPSILKNLHGR